MYASFLLVVMSVNFGVSGAHVLSSLCARVDIGTFFLLLQRVLDVIKFGKYNSTKFFPSFLNFNHHREVSIYVRPPTNISTSV